MDEMVRNGLAWCYDRSHWAGGYVCYSIGECHLSFHRWTEAVGWCMTHQVHHKLTAKPYEGITVSDVSATGVPIR
jgi:hypothetical protein